MARQHGLTTIDLVIVAAVLVMLAAFAVPRYSAINSETRASAVRSLAANIEGSANLSHRIWRSVGYPRQIVVDGQTIELINGYPTEESIRKVIVGRNEFVYSNGIWAHKDRQNKRGCEVLYIPPAESDSGVQVISYTSAC